MESIYTPLHLISPCNGLTKQQESLLRVPPRVPGVLAYRAGLSCPIRVQVPKRQVRPRTAIAISNLETLNTLCVCRGLRTYGCWLHSGSHKVARKCASEVRTLASTAWLGFSRARYFRNIKVSTMTASISPTVPTAAKLTLRAL